MKWRSRLITLCAALALTQGAAASQSASGGEKAQDGAAAARLELQRLLAHIEVQSEAAVSDMAELEIPRWRANSRQKREAQSHAESLQRNMRAALPVMVAAVREAPEGFGPSFKLYRNLNALHDVMAVLAQSASAFGSREEFEALAERARFFDEARRSLGDRLEAMAEARDAELGRLRAAERAREQPPRKIIVDQELPPKPRRKP